MKFKFEMDSRESYPNSDINGSHVIVEFEEVSLSEVQAYFEQFVKACGFHLGCPDCDREEEE